MMSKHEKMRHRISIVDSVPASTCLEIFILTIVRFAEQAECDDYNHTSQKKYYQQ